jgi:tetratricopeptide (TPR) repeat protein
LDSLSAEIRLAYALAVLVPLGRFDEALQHARRAAKLDPVTPMIVAGPAVVQTYGRQYEDAGQSFEDALELDPSNPVVNLWSSVLWIELREYDRAMSAVEHARPFELLAKETAAVVQASAGNRAKAERLMTELQGQAEHGRREASLSVARIAAALGDQEHALIWLDRAVQEGIVATVLLAVDPCYDTLRASGRFANLLHQLHLS